MKDFVKKFPPAFPDFPHMIHGGDYNPDQWLDCPKVLREDVRLMNLAGVNNASVAIFAWKALEPSEGVYAFEWLDETLDRLHAGGISVILATPSGARPDWMDKKYPEVLRTEANRVRNLHGMRHNHCYTSPVYRKKVAEMNRMLANRYGKHPAVKMWHISNEYGGECHCELCQEAFRGWLRDKYGSIDVLNKQWWTGFWSSAFTDFSDIESPAPHGERAIHGLNLDWKRFVTWQTTEFIKNETAPLKEITPHLPVVTNLMGLYPGLDPWKMAEHLDRVSWDNYPDWHTDSTSLWEMGAAIGFVHDINRSLKGGKPFLLMESAPSMVNWKPYNKLKRPGMHILSSLQAVAHGSDSVQYFQWRKGRGASEKFHGAVVDHCGRENTRVFREVAELGGILKKLDGAVGTTTRAQAAIIYDWENRWAIEDLQGLSVDRNYPETCIQHYTSFWKRGIDCDIISMDCSFEGYRVVVAPMLYMLKPGVAKRLKEFTEAGGTVVLTYCCGYVNENDLCFLGGFPGDGLWELAGVWAEEIDSLYPTDRNSLVFPDGKEFEAHTYCEQIHPGKSCQVLAVYGSDFYKGKAALTKNPYGAGACYYIAARTNEDMLDDFYDRIIRETGIQPYYFTSLPTGVTVRERKGDGETYLFVMNFSEEEQKVALAPGYDYMDALSGSAQDPSLTLKPYGWSVLYLYDGSAAEEPEEEEQPSTEPAPAPEQPLRSSQPPASQAAVAPLQLHVTNGNGGAQAPIKQVVCSRCGASSRINSKFCSSCGRKLIVKNLCPSCGNEVEPGDRFCGDCGCALGDYEEGHL